VECEGSHVKKETYFPALKAGFQEVADNKVAKSIILIGISWGLAGGGYAILIPTLGEMVYGMGGFGIGLLYAIDGLGVLLGAVFVRRFVGSSDQRANLWYGIAYLTQALFFALLAQSALFLFGALMLLLMRFSSGMIIPLDSYLMQSHTKAEVRGRVFSLHNSTYSGVMQLSYAISGYLFESVGIPMRGLIIGFISFLCGSFCLLQMKEWTDSDSR
jgi:predicted MFS family arabinose efflux permease